MKNKLYIVIVGLLWLALGACSHADNGQKNPQEKGWIDHEFIQSELDDLQQKVNEGHRPGLTDPVQVAREFIDEQGWEVDHEVEKETVVDQESSHILQYTLQDGRTVQVELIQPSDTGKSGVYVVNRFRFIDQE